MPSIFGKKSQQKGQTLLETILAIGIVMTAVIASITIGIFSIQIGRTSQNRLIASNLAREGMEYVRNMRDSNWLSGGSFPAWYNIMGNNRQFYLGFDQNNPPYFNLNLAIFNPPGVKTIQTCTNCDVYLTNDGIYNQNNVGTKTIFRRMIESFNSGSDKQIITRVYWKEKNKEKQVILEEILTDWRYE